MNGGSYENVRNVLSLPVWREKHSKKLSGLSKYEIKKRYEQYLTSEAVSSPGERKKMRRASKAFGYGSTQDLTLGSLSQCTKDYARALIDPWSVPRPPCVPDLISLPSYKFGTQSRGTFVIGTQGVGFVAINPYAVGQPATGLALVPFSYTDATYAQPYYVPNSGTGTSDPTVDGQLGYLDTPLNIGNSNISGFSYRPVGAGVKARYSGPELTRAGRMIAYREATNQPLETNLNGNELLNNREASITPNDRKYHYATWKPALQADLAYRTGQAITYPTMIMYIDGATPGTSFEFDIQMWFEVIGRQLPSLTKSHSDPLGMAAVQDALINHQPTRTPETEFQNFVNKVIGGAKEAFSFISPIISAVGGLENVIPVASALLM